MNLNELETLAKAVYGPTKDDWELKQALYAFHKAANPQIILELITLCKQQHEALNSKYIVGCGAWQLQRDQALAAYMEFGK